MGQLDYFRVFCQSLYIAVVVTAATILLAFGRLA
jgi:ABC-type spermidine/putrescine transport system permease subunit I